MRILQHGLLETPLFVPISPLFPQLLSKKSQIQQAPAGCSSHYCAAVQCILGHASLPHFSCLAPLQFSSDFGCPLVNCVHGVAYRVDGKIYTQIAICINLQNDLRNRKLSSKNELLYCFCLYLFCGRILSCVDKVTPFREIRPQFPFLI